MQHVFDHFERVPIGRLEITSGRVHDARTFDRRGTAAIVRDFFIYRAEAEAVKVTIKMQAHSPSLG